jgi:xanthine/CO dehydrogenase XdhC/CoxF family maturation factor
MASGAEISSIVRLARACASEGVRTVLAQLVSVEGSHYRKPGARMLMAEDGRAAGAISAGCLEADLRSRIPGVFSGGRSESIEYDSRTFEDLVWGLGSGCNGKVGVILSPFEGALRETLERAAEILEGGGTIFLATALAPAPGSENGPGDVRLLDGPDGVSGDRASDFLVEEISPPVSLLVAGAGPDAVPLARFALDLGWRVSVWSSRDRSHVEGRFRGLAVERAGGPDSARSIRVHSKTAAVVMSHSFADDAATLEALLPLGFPYLGVMGPRERTARLLRACGASAGATAKIHSPAGMNFGAETAEEIALSIVSEIQAVLAKPFRRPADATE